ncbi:metal ABC transporter solute-binding protein, Zn/Mn family [Paraferrimonas sedimenticola]|uniref:metal ABC transporter solute-binding protein, Zn/Mn family n=1 Tax=Paraferrimonas sedimenticola TaxID=375674 RepID=UPI000BA9B982|nr:zinc ABC transporter substrate-binding protein [Paraferrimonas sedimenticola]
MRINSKPLFALLLSLFSGSALAQLNLFACEPEYAALFKELAPEANVYSATTAKQDPHQVQARPSLISKLRRADLALCAGADLEVGWLPMLQMKANNAKMRPGGDGMLFASDFIDNLDQRDSVSRFDGDVHADGNPHMHFDPYRLLQVAKGVSQALAQTDPDNSASYQANLQRFEQKWQSAISTWEQKAAPLKGTKVIAYHSSFRYLYHWLGMQQVGDLEPKPGLPPSSSHLAKLVNIAKEQQPMAILVTGYQDPRGGEWLSSRTQVPLLILPMSVSEKDGINDLFDLYDTVIDSLLAVE